MTLQRGCCNRMSQALWYRAYSSLASAIDFLRKVLRAEDAGTVVRGEQLKGVVCHRWDARYLPQWPTLSRAYASRREFPHTGGT
jgi:hypothetical protein